MGRIIGRNIKIRRVRIGDGRTDPDWAKRGMENIVEKRTLQLNFLINFPNSNPRISIVIKNITNKRQISKKTMLSL